MTIDRMKRLIDTLRDLIEREFNGYIKINFSQGGLGRVDLFEEIVGDGIGLPVAKKEMGKEDREKGETTDS